MFLSLLGVTFTIALLVSALVAKLFNRPIAAILGRVINESLSGAWHRYIQFAIFVVGVSGGVRIWELEKYITPETKDTPVPALNAERWTLEVYRAVISTLESTAWMLLVFFLIALIAFVIIRAFELRAERRVEAK